MQTVEFLSLEQAVESLFGEETTISKMTPIYGGDINDAYRLCISNGVCIFVKMNAMSKINFFRTEAIGLNAMHSTNTIGVPKVLAIGTDQGRNSSFLMLEFLEASLRNKDYWEVFGYELALMHKAAVGGIGKAGGIKAERKFGFPVDNYIGATPQINTPKKDWISFYRECRLEPQMRMADHYMDSKMRKQCWSVLEHLDQWLREPEMLSLLHGDLWSGNAICGPDGKAWILDPACYVGDFEADLAMTQLFGGFPSQFYAAYRDINPIDAGYRERRGMYDLYHLLNHLNLFGSGYLGEVASILRAYTR